MAKSAHEDNPQEKSQTGYGDQHEDLFSMTNNPDKRHNQDHMRLDHSVASFLDQPIKLDDAMEISAHAFDEPIEIIAESLDRLVLSGRMSLRHGVLYPAGAESNQVGDIYNEESRPQRPGSSPQEPLDVSAEEEEEAAEGYQPPTEDEIKEMYEEWMEIVKRHPEWRARLTKQKEPLKIDISDPTGTMKGLKDVYEYDLESVRPEEQEEFEQFLEIDRQIEQFEKWQQGQGGGMSKEQSLRCVARYRMLGGQDRDLGLIRRGSRLLISKVRGRRTIASMLDDMANELAYAHYGSSISTLSPEKQLELLERAEKQMLDKYPIMREGQDDGMPPAPDMEKAPSGWEAVVSPDGKKEWRSKDNPEVKLERPEGGI